jgi:hypothetical protein
MVSCWPVGYGILLVLLLCELVGLLDMLNFWPGACYIFRLVAMLYCWPDI